VQLLQLAYRRAKQADPNCVILSAGLAQTLETGPMNLNDLTYLQQMYDAGVRDYFDIMGVMAYGLWTGPGDHRASPELTNFSRPQLIREVMVRNGDAHKPLWATEVGWNALPPDFPAFPLYGRVDVWQQARYAVQAYQRAQQEWPWMGVMNYWFFKRATDAETDQAFYYFRMVEPSFAPLPVYAAMKQYANQPPHVYRGYHQEDHWALQWEGAWEQVQDGQATLGGLRRATESGAALRFTFVGTELQLVVHKSSQGSTLQISIDGKAVPELDLLSTNDQYGVLVPVARGLPSGPHQVEIVVGDRPGPQADIDGLLVRNHPQSWLRSASILLTIVLGLAFLFISHRRRRHATVA
jgi:hypothetical protein